MRVQRQASSDKDLPDAIEHRAADCFPETLNRPTDGFRISSDRDKCPRIGRSVALQIY
jgi:hypothetical protein